MSKFIVAAVLAVPLVSSAQTEMTVYSNALVNGWQNWGWATLNYANISPVYTGCQDSISVTITGGYAGIQIYHPDMSSAPYASISFWLNGGANGGQSLQVYGLLDANGSANDAQNGRYYMSAPPANTWVQYTVPLSTLGVASMTNFTGFVIQDSACMSEPTFYLDNIQLNGVAGPPPQTPVTVNAGETIRTVDGRWFGVNATIWDNNFDTPQTIQLLTNMGIQALRFPGGSLSDDFHWVYNRQDNNDWAWGTSLASYIQVITNINAQTMITVNYGTGSSNEAGRVGGVREWGHDQHGGSGHRHQRRQLAYSGILGVVARGLALGHGRRQKFSPHRPCGSAGIQVLGNWQRGIRFLGNGQQRAAARSLYLRRAGGRIHGIDAGG